jgi:hypothetical protein
MSMDGGMKISENWFHKHFVPGVQAFLTTSTESSVAGR